MTALGLTGVGAGSEFVRSVQHFEITMGASATTGTATITAVDTSRSIVLYSGFYSPFSTTGGNTNLMRLDLTNSTTVTATRNTSAVQQPVARGCVIEFAPSVVKSVQQGSTTMAAAATSNTTTISSVDTANSVVFHLGHSTTLTTFSTTSIFGTVTLTDATTITVNRGASSNALTVGWVVLEFNPGYIKSLQTRTVTLTSNTTSSTDTITSVDTANSFIVYQGVLCAGSTIQTNWFYTTVLTSSTQVTLTRSNTSTTSRTARFTVVELQPGLIRSLQRQTTNIASGATDGSTTISSVDTSKAAYLWNHMNPNNTTSNQCFSAGRLQAATDVDADRNTSGANTVDVASEIVEFY